MDYLIEKLKEPSTWKGLVWLLTAFGVALSPDEKEAIAALGMALAGLIGVFVERGNAHTEKQIMDLAQQVHEEQVKKIVSKKNAKIKKNVSSGDSGNFFDDGNDGGDD